MCEHFDYTVRRLQRVRIMHIHLGDLPVGKWRPLTEAEVRPLLPGERAGRRPTLRLRKH
jgi:23S rRNA pseudouridine2604 synthase